MRARQEKCARHLHARTMNNVVTFSAYSGKGSHLCRSSFIDEVELSLDGLRQDIALVISLHECTTEQRKRAGNSKAQVGATVGTDQREGTRPLSFRGQFSIVGWGGLLGWPGVSLSSSSTVVVYFGPILLALEPFFAGGSSRREGTSGTSGTSASAVKTKMPLYLFLSP